MDPRKGPHTDILPSKGQQERKESVGNIDAGRASVQHSLERKLAPLIYTINYTNSPKRRRERVAVTQTSACEVHRGKRVEKRALRELCGDEKIPQTSAYPCKHARTTKNPDQLTRQRLERVGWGWSGGKCPSNLPCGRCRRSAWLTTAARISPMLIKQCKTCLLMS